MGCEIYDACRTRDVDSAVLPSNMDNEDESEGVSDEVLVAYVPASHQEE